MSDDVNYQNGWAEEATQCRNCAQFQSHGGRNACVPPGEDFEGAIEAYGEVSPDGHCNYFTPKS